MDAVVGPETRRRVAMMMLLKPVVVTTPSEDARTILVNRFSLGCLVLREIADEHGKQVLC